MNGVGRGAPPQITGYSFRSYLGGGGFADVFLYDHLSLQRQVAVKVLKANIDDLALRQLFAAEANLMAKLSNHPHIVTIYDAAMSVDGRPYLLMEYYPGRERFSNRRVDVREALSVGVKISCAVETVHQARIVHRDIKPGDILISKFGEPGLTDCGISGTQGESNESHGYTPAFAAPEILANVHPGDVRSDLYSLAATVWAMLAGHAPFELPGGRNSQADLIARGLNASVPPLPPGVASPELERVLRHALEKDPARRPSTARELASMLTAVESQLGLPVTPGVLSDDASDFDSAIADVADALEKTRTRQPVVVDLAAPVVGTMAERTDEDTRIRGRVEDSVAPVAPPAVGPVVTFRPAMEGGPFAEPSAGHPDAPRNRTPTPAARRALWIAAGGVAAALASTVAVVVWGGRGEGTRPDPTVASGPLEAVPLPGVGEGLTTLAPVSGLQASSGDGTVTFEWSHPAVDGLAYRVERVDGGNQGLATVTEPEYVITDLADGERPCVIVTAFVEGVVVADPSEVVCSP